MFGFSPYYRDQYAESSHGPSNAAMEVVAAAQSSSGDTAAEINEGSEWFSVHSTSVGISFGAIASFLVCLAIVWACYKSALCGLFNICLWCKPRPQAPTTAYHGPHSAVPFPPAQSPAFAYDPYASIGPGSAASASTIYGMPFGARAALPAPHHPAPVHMVVPPTNRNRRDRSPSTISRVFFDARRDAARYVNRFSEVDSTSDPR